MSVLMVIFYSFTLWLGLYLLRRSPQLPGMRYAGLGLMAYAVGLLLAGLTINMPELARWHGAVALIPAVCWLLSVRALWAHAQQTSLPRRPLALIVTATLFFALGSALFFLPQAWFTNDVILLLIGMDLVALGYAMARLEAWQEGAALLPDMLRSGLITLVGMFIFGGQIVLVMAIEGVSAGLQVLLIGTISGVIVIEMFAPLWQSGLDTLFFTPTIQTERAQLQAVASALTRTDTGLDMMLLDEREFTRLTRRALAHLGDLEHLAASPLIHLPLIATRLQHANQPDSTLTRATLLKQLLTESIEHLKPPHGTSGTSDEWRYYNALYFPYVLGLKPYSRRYDYADLDAAAQTALDWLQTNVPERTLYNWQNKAAELIAQELRELAANGSAFH
jgi:hypothetical protein